MQGRKILLGISGSISAYKTLELIRLIIKAGGEVKVVMTRNATELLAPLSVEVLSENRVYIEEFALGRGSIDHIELHRWADVFAVCPATANVIAKAAHGIADDLLSGTLVTIGPGKTAIFPAMNTNMWFNPATQANVRTLEERGAYIAPTGTGLMATRSEGEGAGRLLEPPEIFDHLEMLLESRDSSLMGKKVLLSAGGTREPLDDVRFLGNRSSGKMGRELARAFSILGAEVTLVSTTEDHPGGVGVELVQVETAAQMKDALEGRFAGTDVLVMCAAVADYRPKTRHPGKLDRRELGATNLELEPTEDILKHLGELKKDGQMLVGFAAEVDDHQARAEMKLREKGLDIIVMNDVSGPQGGFDSEMNAATLIFSNGEKTDVPLTSKRELARIIARAVKDRIKE